MPKPKLICINDNIYLNPNAVAKIEVLLNSVVVSGTEKQLFSRTLDTPEVAADYAYAIANALNGGPHDKDIN